MGSSSSAGENEDLYGNQYSKASGSHHQIYKRSQSDYSHSQSSSSFFNCCSSDTTMPSLGRGSHPRRPIHRQRHRPSAYSGKNLEHQHQQHWQDSDSSSDQEDLDYIYDSMEDLKGQMDSGMESNRVPKDNMGRKDRFTLKEMLRVDSRIDTEACG